MPSLLPAAPAFSLLFCPLSPRPPSPVGKGEIKVIFMQGAAPLASPRLNPRGTGKWGRITRPAGGLAPALQARRALAAPGGGRAFFVACLLLPLVSFFAPSPRPPSRREGGDFRLFYARGCAPCIPAPEPARRWEMGANHAPGGGRAFILACLPLPLAFFPAPIPPAPFPAGRGRLRLFSCKGLRPLHPCA